MEGAQKKVISLLLKASKTLGLSEEQRERIYLLHFPGWKQVLESLKQNPTIDTPVGKIQLLPPYYDPEERWMDYPKGMFFVDGLPIQQVEDRWGNGFPLNGMNIYIDSNKSDEFKKHLKKEDLYSKIMQTHIDVDDFKPFINEIIGYISPEEALSLLKLENKKWLYKDEVERPYSTARGDYFDALCSCVSQKKGLFSPPKNWFIGSEIFSKNPKYTYIMYHADGSRDYFGESKAHDRDFKYLESLGYIPVSESFAVFGVPPLKLLIDKLISEETIPANPEERVLFEQKKK